MEMINSDRTAFITLGGQEYELMLTTLATKSIARRYGGLENLGEKSWRAVSILKTRWMRLCG